MTANVRGTDAGADAAPGLLELLAEDFEIHGQRVLSPGFHALAVHRVGVWARSLPWLPRKVVGALYVFVNDAVIRNLYGIEISRTTVIGRRLWIGHHQGVILGHSAVIGDDCLVRQGVTLGQPSHNRHEQPTVGNGVHFGANATVIGPVHIGDGAQIGPNTVVTRSVPAGATAFAAPARILKAPEPDQR